jgi:hypothetical protein
MEVVAEHQVVPKEEAAVEIIGALKELYGVRHLAVGGRRRQKKRTQADSEYQKKLVASLKRDDPPCRSCTTQGTQSSGTRQGQCSTGNLERAGVREQTSDTTGMSKLNKEPDLSSHYNCEAREMLTRPSGRP